MTKLPLLGLALTLCANPTAPTIDVRVGQLAGLTVAPADARLRPGQAQQYTSSATWRKGRPGSYPVTWSATGGTITPSGLYTAGSMAGTYKVCATSGAFMPCVDLTLITTPTTQTIAPGENWQDKVNANAAGTAFRILAGTHARATVRPKSGDQFIADPGAVMDGQNVTQYAFTSGTTSPYPSDVVIDGLEVKNYAPPSQMAAIRASGDFTASASSGWQLLNLNVHHSSQVGVRIGSNMVVRDCLIHDNTTFGISGPGDDTEIDGVTVTNNGSISNAESGGSKFVRTNRLWVHNSTFSLNNNAALWLDIANLDYVLEDNLLEDNKAESIMIEISYGGIIRDNTIRRGGLDDPRASSFPWAAAILISASGGAGIEITGNTLVGNAHGVSLVEQFRGTNNSNDPTGIDPVMQVKNINSHGNTITLANTSGHLHAGSFTAETAASDYSTGIFQSSRNIDFDTNILTLNGKSSPFAWDGGFRSQAYWTGTAGFDTGSTITP